MTQISVHVRCMLHRNASALCFRHFSDVLVFVFPSSRPSASTHFPSRDIFASSFGQKLTRIDFLFMDFVRTCGFFNPLSTVRTFSDLFRSLHA